METSIVSLPFEVVCKIFEYLDASDRAAASLTCKLWYTASLEKHFWKNMAFIIEHEIVRPAEILSRTEIPVQHLVLKEIELTNDSMGLYKFGEQFGRNLSSLVVDNCYITDRMLTDILKFCPKLLTLHINGCRDLLMSGNLFQHLDDLPAAELEAKFPKLENILLENCRYSSDALFNRLMLLTPTLKSLSLAGTQISFHPGIYRKFYPSSGGTRMQPSDSILTFVVILEWLRKHASSLRVLDFSSTLIDSNALTLLSQIQDLHLQKLMLRSCEISKIGIEAICLNQKSLTELDVGLCSRITDQALICICDNLPNLRLLSLQRCRAVTNAGVSHLCRLTQLEDLNLQGVEVTCEGISSGLTVENRPGFRKLNVSATPIGEVVIGRICMNLPNLVHLDLSSCPQAITDMAVQIICVHLKKLQVLKLAWCKMVTDAGLTGQGLDFDQREKFVSEAMDQMSLENLPGGLSNGAGPKISLGSKAERQIVEDTSRKFFVQKKIDDYERGLVDSNTIANLTGLWQLDLCACDKVTDVSVRYVLRFKGLRYLNLSSCQQITDEGIAQLGINNPSLEVLILTQCCSITDHGFKALVENLPRLKRLEIQGCRLLTNAGLVALGSSCPQLRYLDVSHCSRITLEGADLLEQKITALREFIRVGLKSEYEELPLPTMPQKKQSKSFLKKLF